MKKIILFLALLLLPITVNASTTDKYYIEANIKSNGDIEVKELKVLDGSFNGIYTNLRYTNYGLQKFSGILDDFEGSDIYNATNIEDLKVYAVDLNNLSFDNILDRATLFTEASSAEVGDYGVYVKSTNSIGVDLSIYMPSTYGEASLVTYTLKDAVVIHNDVAEVAWDFISSSYEEDINDLTITINLPGDSEELRVFSHGPLSGTNEIVSDSEVKAIWTNLPAYKAVDVRVVFDKSLVPNGTKTSGIDGLDNILAVEKARADKANAERQRIKTTYIILTVLFGGYVAGAIVVAIRYYLKYDKEYKVNFNGDYYREFIEDYDVEVIDYLFNKSITPNAMSASIMNLIYKKKIDIEKIMEKNKESYKFILKTKEGASPTEIKLLYFLFDKVGNGKEFTIKELKDYARGSSYQTFLNTYSDWKKSVLDDGHKQDFYEDLKKPKTFGILYALLGGLLFFLNMFYQTDIIFGRFLFPVAIGLLIYMIAFKRKTKKGAEHYTKWTKFKNFLNDFGNFKEKELPEVKLWERYLVYATVFGIAEKVSKTMNVKIHEMDPKGTMYDYDLMPLFYLNMNSEISSAINNAVRESVTSAIAKSAESSSSGGGGGSSFGGGGFGGGGSGGGRF